MKLKYFILLILFVPFISKAQFSKTHYIPPLTSSTSVSPQEQYLYISTPNTNAINVRIIEIGGTTYNRSVSKSNPIEHYIGFGPSTQLQVNKFSTGAPLNNKGYIIEADDMVYVTARVLAGSYNQAGALVSKGLASLGTQFRVGAFINIYRSGNQPSHLTFFSILATENNTQININHKAGLTFVNPIPTNFNLNRGESFIAAVDGNAVLDKDGLIGTLISSNKPIAVNCGSYGGTNGELSNIDLGFDQIVSAERTGQEYIFIKGNGMNNVEIPLIVAHEDNTEIYLNGNPVPFSVKNAGEYLSINGNQYSSNGNLFVSTSKKVFAYQGLGDVGGSPNSQANQEMFFVPPLSCETPKVIDNIPNIQYIGNRPFTGSLSLVTENGATLKIGINGVLYDINSLPGGVTYNGPLNVIGNSSFVTYTIKGLSGNISVESTKQVYLSYYGSNGAASYGGFYSGFPYKPEVISDKITITNTNCIPNVELKLNSITAYDAFQWYFNDVLIPGATNNSYKPTEPGYYHVEGVITGCGTFVASDKIPVSSCPTDFDKDGIFDNVDIDYDGDGITNCTESYGDTILDFTNLTAGSILNNSYSNTFTGETVIKGTSATIPVKGFSDGTIITEVPIELNEVTYTASFNKPISLSVVYPQNSTEVGEFLSSDEEFIIKVPVDKTITLLDPDDQLLIDTDYDGIYESGITEYSSFELRFRLKSSFPLAFGMGTFSFKTHMVESIAITHRNLSEDQDNKAAFKITATCVPYDTDGDGIFDYADLDSDNDGIPDSIEMHGKNFISKSFVDLNRDGLDDAFTGISPSDTDNDNIPDYLDLDSDNDGIYDLVEAGHTALDTNNDGVVDGNSTDFGTNGLLDSLETLPDSFILNYTVLDSDNDGIWNFVDWDSDGDNCSDVIEAGFLDSDNDNYLGAVPLSVNLKGLVTSGVGYTTPLSNYLDSAPIIISQQLLPEEVCEEGEKTLVIEMDNNSDYTYQWEISLNGGANWNTLNNDATYSGVTSNQLKITNATLFMHNYQYRVFLNKVGNTCGLYSNSVVLTVNPLPVVKNAVLFQCDDDTDGFTYFNLNEANQLISSNYKNETFSFFTTQIAAETNDSAFKIINPIAYNANSQFVWARIESNKFCYRTAQIEIKVSTTNIPAGYMHNFEQCDDYDGTNGSDIDGIATFDFSHVEADLRSKLPPTNQPISITFYKNLADALAEQDKITDTSNYRNSGYPNQQKIYIRIDSDNDNECLGLGHHITLTVNPIPTANPVNPLVLCDDIADGDDANGIVQTFDLGSQTSTILGSQNPVNFTLTYHANLVDANSGLNPLPLIYANTTRDKQTIYVRIVNNTTNCINPHLTFDLIVNPLPIIKTPIPLQLCDDLTDGDNRNGIVQSFNLNSKNAEILNGLSLTLYTVTYHTNLSDANNGTNSLTSPYTNSTPNSQLLFIRVTNNTTGCYNTKERLQLIINELPTITTIPDFELCDDLSDGNDSNGFRTFDLESKTTSILGSQSSSNFKVTYHRSQTDANSGNSALSSPFTNEIKNQQRIYIRILNLSTGCFIADNSFNIVVKQKPVFEVDTEQIVCLNNLPLTLSIKSSLEPYSFNWYDSNGTLLASNSRTVAITKGGKYTVTTSNAIGCDRSIEINVKESIIATIKLDNLTIVDNSNNNSITINNNNQEIGIGDYEYALDNDFGPFQDEPRFEHVEAGVRTLYIRDKNRCGTVSIEVPIIGNPGFFTPNNDGHNDTWQILGIRLYPKSVIYIFDRFGKVLATISPTGKGWDGTSRGKPVDSGEYWFSAQLDNGRVIKGHFSLIRR